MGEQYLYKIDRDNQMLVAFGDETRVASVEYSIIEHFKHLSQSEKSVYYVDLNCNPDRQVNAVTAKYDGDTDDVCYVATDVGDKSVIDEVYSILKSRRQLSRTNRAKDIGDPIELIIHNAERISELGDEKGAPVIKPMTRMNIATAAIPDALDDFLSEAETTDSAPLDDSDDICTQKKLCEIIENGKNSRIYVMLYFEERNRFQNFVGDLFAYNYDFKDVLIVPTIPDEYEQLSYSEVVDSLSACRLRELATEFEQTKLEKNDFVCAVIIDDKVAHKIIPYEWSAE